MGPHDSLSRRRVVALAGALGAASIAGCTGGDDDGAPSSTSTTERRATDTATPEQTPTGTAEGTALVDAIERSAVEFDLAADSTGLDAVAGRLADSSLVGIGENSHGVAEFKHLASRLVRRLVADQGYRLLAVEGTLGDFAPVDDYVAGGDTDLDAAMAGLDFYFWKTDAIRGLFEWLREFNAARPAADRVVVRGYDAQFFDANARAVRDYLERVDPPYLETVTDELTPLTEPLYERHDAEFVTDARTALLDSLAERLASHRDEYVAASSASAWRLARRHVRTLERGLRFQERLRAEQYTQGKRIRDAAMADNVAWLREWTGLDRAAGAVATALPAPLERRVCSRASSRAPARWSGSPTRRAAIASVCARRSRTSTRASR